MNHIEAMLIEEHKRLKIIVNLFSKRISEYPKGSIQIKKRGDESYMYLAMRINGKHITKYYGNVKHKVAKQLVKDVAERKKIEVKLKSSIALAKDVKKRI